MVAISHMWLWGIWKMADLNWDVLKEFKGLGQQQEDKISLWKTFILITCWNDNILDVLGLIKCIIKNNFGTSLAVQWLRLHASTTGSMGSIPGRRAKIAHAAGRGQKKKKKKKKFHLLTFYFFFNVAAGKLYMWLMLYFCWRVLLY